MALKIDYDRCNACKTCYEQCPGDVIGWDVDNDIPVDTYPDECWYCGNCEIHCPTEAINILIPPRFF